MRNMSIWSLTRWVSVCGCVVAILAGSSAAAKSPGVTYPLLGDAPESLFQMTVPCTINRWTGYCEIDTGSYFGVAIPARVDIQAPIIGQTQLWYNLIGMRPSKFPVMRAKLKIAGRTVPVDAFQLPNNDLQYPVVGMQTLGRLASSINIDFATGKLTINPNLNPNLNH